MKFWAGVLFGVTMEPVLCSYWLYGFIEWWCSLEIFKKSTNCSLFSISGIFHWIWKEKTYEPQHWWDGTVRTLYKIPLAVPHLNTWLYFMKILELGLFLFIKIIFEFSGKCNNVVVHNCEMKLAICGISASDMTEASLSLLPSKVI